MFSRWARASCCVSTPMDFLENSSLQWMLGIGAFGERKLDEGYELGEEFFVELQAQLG